ncbi:MAG: hypothetical protein NT040_19210 [Bacteroidetes bacterium]|nr:hypothetical protein [Bacteroidota bacterium]
MTGFTAIPVLLHVTISTPDKDGFAINKSLGNGPAGFFINPCQGRTRNSHFLRSL